MKTVPLPTASLLSGCVRQQFVCPRGGEMQMNCLRHPFRMLKQVHATLFIEPLPRISSKRASTLPTATSKVSSATVATPNDSRSGTRRVASTTSNGSRRLSPTWSVSPAT